MEARGCGRLVRLLLLGSPLIHHLCLPHSHSGFQVGFSGSMLQRTALPTPKLPLHHSVLPFPLLFYVSFSWGLTHPRQELHHGATPTALLPLHTLDCSLLHLPYSFPSAQTLLFSILQILEMGLGVYPGFVKNYCHLNFLWREGVSSTRLWSDTIKLKWPPYYFPTEYLKDFFYFPNCVHTNRLR